MRFEYRVIGSMDLVLPPSIWQWPTARAKQFAAAVEGCLTGWPTKAGCSWIPTRSRGLPRSISSSGGSRPKYATGYRLSPQQKSYESLCKRVILVPMNKGMERAIAIAGGQARLAEVLGTSPSSISKYLYGKLEIPIRIVLKLERHRKFRIPRGEMRPDLKEEYGRSEAKEA